MKRILSTSVKLRLLCVAVAAFSGGAVFAADDTLQLSFSEIRVAFNATTSTLSVQDELATSMKVTVRDALDTVVDQADIALASDFDVLLSALVGNPAGFDNVTLNGTIRGTDVATTLGAPSYSASYTNTPFGADLDGITFFGGTLLIAGVVTAETPPSILRYPLSGDWKFVGTSDAPTGAGSDGTGSHITVSSGVRNQFDGGTVLFVDIALPVLADGTSTSGFFSADELFAAAMTHGGFDSSGGDMSIHLFPTPADCGNGILDPGEDCDNGSANSNVVANACRTDCLFSRCGDGIRDTDEECDGNDDFACPGGCEGCHCTMRLPTVSDWGMAILSLLMLAGLTIRFHARGSVTGS